MYCLAKMLGNWARFKGKSSYIKEEFQMATKKAAKKAAKKKKK